MAKMRDFGEAPRSSAKTVGRVADVGGDHNPKAHAQTSGSNDSGHDTHIRGSAPSGAHLKHACKHLDNC